MNFFILLNPLEVHGETITSYLPADGSNAGEAPRCSACGEPVGMLPLLPPVCVEVEALGSRWGDVAFGPGDQILISEKLKALFANTDLVGFVRLDPVRVVKAKQRKSRAGEPPVYWLASIQRSRAALDESASGLVRDEAATCIECRIGGTLKRVERVILEPGTWSGEDVFIARGLPGRILASERFKHLCEANELANCSFMPAEDFGFNHYPQEGLAGGR
jgi:hypothetical protein